MIFSLRNHLSLSFAMRLSGNLLLTISKRNAHGGPILSGVSGELAIRPPDL